MKTRICCASRHTRSGYPVVGAPGGIVCSEQEIIATSTLLLHAFFIA